MKAYELIEKYGWVQGSFGDKDRGFCMAGAINAAYKNHTTRERLGGLLDKKCNGDLVSWNDTAGRRKQTVIRKLRSLNI